MGWWQPSIESRTRVGGRLLRDRKVKRRKLIHSLESGLCDEVTD